MDGYPEISIDQTMRPQSHQRDPRLTNTELSYLKIPYISEQLNHRITNLVFLEKRTSQYMLSTDYTPSDELSPTTPPKVHAPGKSAPFPKPNCTYEERSSTKSDVTTAINNASVALHVSSRIV